MKTVFHGGIHPSDWKELTSEIKPVEFPAPDKVIIPLRQYIGRECASLVAVDVKAKKLAGIVDAVCLYLACQCLLGF